MEILTGIPAGERGEDGEYPAGTINYLVEQKLKQYYEMLGKRGRDQEKASDQNEDAPQEDEADSREDDDHPQEGACKD